MPDPNSVTTHYMRGGLIKAITAGLKSAGKSPETATVADLASVDEFHIGGRQATEDFLDQLGLSPDDHVLDVGCGIGGTSRFVAECYGSRVTGIDLTVDFIDTGRVMCRWVGLEDRVALEQGNAITTPYPDGTFDMAFMMHVGMNISDKTALMAELHRVLKDGGRLGIYDVMRTGDGDLAFPLPWASVAESSAVSPPEHYRNALTVAGFRLVAERNRRDFAVEFFARLQARTSAAGGPPPLGLHILMGETAPLKIRNMVENISQGRIAPVELIAEKTA